MANKDLHPPTHGKIDIHSHLLPGVDDGCQNLSQTVACIRRLQEAGFSGSVCTPHVGAGWYKHNTPDMIASRLEELRGALQEENIDYALWDGGEVRMNDETIDWFSYWGLPTLGPGRCVLMDWWGNDWPDFCTDACVFLLDNGYQPILAHPERMNLGEESVFGLVDELQQRGVWMQGNLNSIAGGEGLLAQKIAQQLLRESRYHVIATDLHHPKKADGRMTGVRMLSEQFGESQAKLLLEQRPREVLLHQAIS